MVRPDQQKEDGQKDSSAGNKEFTAPAINLPKGGGAIRGMGEKFAANPVTGTGSMTVPIATSPGRSGFGPQLSLSYDSGAGNGPFGLGWHLSLPAITRKTDKGLPRYKDAEESDVFILSGAEDLVPVLTQDTKGNWVPEVVPPRVVDGKTYNIKRYRPRVEGLFARIERWTNQADAQETFWRSISKENITTWYGRTPESRIADPIDPSHIFSWLICESYDDKGNAILYEYAEENDDNIDQTQANEHNRVRTASRYIERIHYGNKTSRLIEPDLSKLDWHFHVVFDYEEGHYKNVSTAGDDPFLVEAWDDPPTPVKWPLRQDPFSSYRSGFEVRTYRLCRRVLMFHDFGELGDTPCLARSTEFAYDEGPVATFITSVIQSGYVRQKDLKNAFTNRYLKKSLPPVQFTYSKVPTPQELAQLPVEEPEAESLENLPVGIGPGYQWVDLDGEGISGILVEQQGAWYYKENLGEAKFGPMEQVANLPSLGAWGGNHQFLDLAGDGQLDVVMLDSPAQGFYERTEDASWEPFRTFASLPNLSWKDPNLKIVDLNGDGIADILITEDEAFTWYPSLLEEGFGPANRVQRAPDEEKGPYLILADGTQSIYLLDMSGDGLSDLVRIRNGEVCYWPNLGYGRFGAKVTMDNSPWFDTPDLFDEKRIHLADTDGSGTTDIIYLHSDGVRIYFNQSGNRWSDPVPVPQFPSCDNLTALQVIDLLGSGTACLVWSSPLPGNARRQMRYVDLMGGQKPHLLIKTENNLGAETLVTYAHSTKFYLQDKKEGSPWITRLPFPVHVVERVETYDHISRNRFVTGYAYHHGYFDGIEREFRGFGMVEQWDTEEFAALTSDGALPKATNLDVAFNVPPVLTKTWFHTGAYLEEGRISRHFEEEYYREGDPSLGEGGLTDKQFEAILLPDTVLPETLRPGDGTQIPFTLPDDEIREACRALKGRILRQEVYALDRHPDGKPTEESDRPYTVSERNYAIEILQPKSGNKHAVFFAHPRETIDFHYERKLFDLSGVKRADPRATHSIVLKVDDYGNIERSVSIGYRRRDLPDIYDEQKATHLTFTVSRFANRSEEPDWYHVGLPVETRTYEIVRPPEPPLADEIVGLFACEELDGLTGKLFPPDLTKPDAAKTWPYEKWDWRRNSADAPSETKLRLIEHVRTLYRKDNLTDALPLGQIESMALPFESYKLAFTPALVTNLFVSSGQSAVGDVDQVFGTDGGYVHSEGDTNWWIPSGRVFYDVAADPNNPAATATQELARARGHFFLPRKFTDPFGQSTTVDYDNTYDLLIVDTRDALGNTVYAQNDYRVLQPQLLTDPNGNQTAAAFDALGMVVGTAVMGKPLPAPVEGDSLDGFDADLTEAVILDHLKTPLTDPNAILQKASTRLVYDLFAFYRTKDELEPKPPVVYTLARETHDADLKGDKTKIQHSFSYSDGFGREIQKKIQAEPGPVPMRDAKRRIIVGPDGQPQMTKNDVSPRWVGSGWTIFNNKGKPVRQYEPFFTDTHHVDSDVRIGVSLTFFYDPVGRVVAKLYPNHTYEKLVFDPWRQETWDVNDTVLIADPKTDPDVGDFFGMLPDADYMPTWHALRLDAANPVAFTAQYPDPTDRANETDSAEKAAIHAATPTIAHADSLGRTFLTIAHNRFKYSDSPPVDPPVEEFYSTSTVLDIENNQREVRDAIKQNVDKLGRIVMRYDYDILSNRAHQASMEAGQRWMLNDVTGKPILSWDSRNHEFIHKYDALRRPIEMWIKRGDGDTPLDHLYEKITYGEGISLNGKGDKELNLRTKPFEHYDTAGKIRFEGYDFKGNLLKSQRRLAKDYKQTVNWNVADTDPLLENETFASSTRYDALNRPIQLNAPHSDQPGTKINIIEPIYNEANLLEQVHAWLNQDTEPTDLVDPGTANLHAVTNIDYNAKGQRTIIQYGNGAETRYRYDRDTFRLVHLYTRRGATFAGDCENTTPPPDTVASPEIPPTNKYCGLQNLHYTYDPVGNITYIRDEAQQTIYFKNQRVEPSNDYTYDAIYRLMEATGREHLGQIALAPIPHSYNDAGRTGIQNPGPGTGFQPGDGSAMGNYCESYKYDAVGNIMEMAHRRTCPGLPSWKRTYAYNETSLIEDGTGGTILKQSNCLSSTTVGNGSPTVESYGYDLHGNMLHMPQLQMMVWDFKDQLQMTQRQKVNDSDMDGIQHQGERTYYVYDSSGQRVRKVTELATGALKDERIYLGGFEIYRNHSSGLKRETFHIMDDKQRIALVETRNNMDDGSPKQLIRNQFSNHLGSAILELDDQAQIISYEEYTPYGSTSYQAVRSQTETPKRYRYTGKERDGDTGLYYYGVRYYAPWLGRWTSCDPMYTSTAVALYTFCSNNPVIRFDPIGAQDEPVKPKRSILSRASGFIGEQWESAVGATRSAQSWVKETALEAGKQDVNQAVALIKSMRAAGVQSPMLEKIILYPAVVSGAAKATALEVAGGFVMLGPNMLEALDTAGHELGEGAGKVWEGKSGEEKAMGVAELGQGTARAALVVVQALTMTRGAGLKEGLKSDPGMTPGQRVQANRLYGKKFEKYVTRQEGGDLFSKGANQVRIRPNVAPGIAGTKADEFVIDTLTRNRLTLKYNLFEAKSTATAPLTKNQTPGFPLMDQFGGEVVGRAGAEFAPGGTIIPPSPVQIVRQNALLGGMKLRLSLGVFGTEMTQKLKE